MAGIKNVHWFSPTVMTVSLAAALGLALGHHFWYHNLSGKPVLSGTYNVAGKHMSRQQFNTSVGNVFAFFVRLFLGITNSAAYAQLFWRSARYAKIPTIQELDWAYTVPTNVFKLFYFHLARRFPSLELAAIILLLTPIATVFTPGTLVVQNVQRNMSSLVEVPNVDFATFAYAADMFPEPLHDNQLWPFRGTSQPIQNLAFAVAASGRGGVPSLFPPSPTETANATWELPEFYMPQLYCFPMDGGEVWKNIYNSYNWSTTGAPVYLSWVPWSEHDAFEAGFNVTAGTSDVQNRDLPYFITDTGMQGPPTSLVSTDGPMSFFVASIPNAHNISIGKNDEGNTTVTPQAPIKPDNSPVVLPADCIWQPMSKTATFEQYKTSTLQCGSSTYRPALIFENATLTRCDIFNVSTRVSFDYTDIAAPVRFAGYNVPIFNLSDRLNGSHYFVGPSELSFYANASQLETLDCTPFVADPLAIIGSPFVSSQTEGGKEPLRSSCEFDVQSLRLLSYQSIMAAFASTFLGNITSTGSSRTSVLNTVFMETNELDWLRDFVVNQAGAYNNIYALSNLYDRIPAAERYRATAARPVIGDQGGLIAALRGSFIRLVLSLFAEPYFYMLSDYNSPNYNSTFAPPRLTNVTTQGYQNIYSYDAATLWWAYGAALLTTALAVTAGWIAIWLNGCSYSNDFSTFIRVGRNAEIIPDPDLKQKFKPEHVKPEHSIGYDPLPDYLEHARMNIAALVGGKTQADQGALLSAKPVPETERLVSDSDDTSNTDVEEAPTVAPQSETRISEEQNVSSRDRQEPSITTLRRAFTT